MTRKEVMKRLSDLNRQILAETNKQKEDCLEDEWSCYYSMLTPRLERRYDNTREMRYAPLSRDSYVGAFMSWGVAHLVPQTLNECIEISRVKHYGGKCPANYIQALMPGTVDTWVNIGCNNTSKITFQAGEIMYKSTLPA